VVFFLRKKKSNLEIHKINWQYTIRGQKRTPRWEMFFFSQIILSEDACTKEWYIWKKISEKKQTQRLYKTWNNNNCIRKEQEKKKKRTIFIKFIEFRFFFILPSWSIFFFFHYNLVLKSFVLLNIFFSFAVTTKTLSVYRWRKKCKTRQISVKLIDFSDELTWFEILISF
jgi:hypothetical protein